MNEQENTQQQQSRLQIRARQVLTINREIQQKDKQDKEADRLAKEQAAEEQLKGDFEAEFREEDKDLLTELAFTCEHVCQRPTITFSCAGLNWEVFREGKIGTAWKWSFKANNNGSQPVWDTCNQHHLQSNLLYYIGNCLEQVELRKQKDEEQKRKNQRREQENQQQIERQAREEEAQIRELDQEDARLRALYEEEKSRRIAAMWHWPEGATCVIYKERHATGIGYTEDREPVTDYEEGWTRNDHLDQQGYIRLEAEYKSWGEKEPVKIKLDLIAHKPVWEEHIIRSAEDLPSELCKHIQFSLKDIYYRRIGPDDKARFTHTSGIYSEYCRENIGIVPIKWVQELLEQSIKE